MSEDISTKIDEELSAVRAWIIWTPAAMMALYFVFIQTSITVMIPQLEKAFSINMVDIGFLSSSFFISYTILQVPSGLIIDKIGARKLLLISVIGLFFSCLIFALSNSFNLSIFSRVLMGIFSAPIFACVFYLAALNFSHKIFPLAVGLTETMTALGGLFSTKFLSISVQRLGWRPTSFICTGLAVVLFILIFLFVKDPKTTNNKIIAIDQTPKKEPFWECFIIVIADKQIWLCSVFAGLIFIPFITFGGLWGVPFIMKAYNLQLESAAGLISILFIGAAIGNVIIPWFSENFNLKKTLMIVCTALDIVFMLIIIYLPLSSTFAIASVLFLIGFFLSAYTIPFIIVKKIVPKKACGTGMAFINAVCGGIGTIIYQPLIGWLLHFFEVASSTGKYIITIESYQNALVIIPISLVIAIVVACLIDKSHFQKA